MSRKAISQYLRSKVYEKHGVTCFYCKETPEYIEIDHVFPVAFGGENNIENLVPCCSRCNSQKFTMDMHEWSFKLEDMIERYEKELLRMKKMHKSVGTLIEADYQEFKEWERQRELEGKN